MHEHRKPDRRGAASGVCFVVLLLVGTAALVTVPITLAFGGVFDTEGVLAVGRRCSRSWATSCSRSTPCGRQG